MKERITIRLDTELIERVKEIAKGREVGYMGSPPKFQTGRKGMGFSQIVREALVQYVNDNASQND